MKILILLCCCLALASLPAGAEDAPPRHSCVKPVHPDAEKLNDPATAKEAMPVNHDFDVQMTRFKDCIWKFVVAERKAAQLHTAAAEHAIEDWYAFIRESLANGALREPR